MLTLELIAQINGRPDGIGLSDDGQWLVLEYGDEWRLFDAFTGKETGRVPDFSGFISPDGRSFALLKNGTLKVTRLDGSQIEKTYPHPTGNYPGSVVCFTSDSQWLWATLRDEQGDGKLSLLDAVTLEEIDSVPMPVAEGDDETTWVEPFLSLHIPTDTLAVQHVGSDFWYLLGVFFFKHHEKQIKQLPGYIAPDSDLSFMRETAFSASGQLFAGIVGGREVWVWQMKNMDRDVLWNVLDDEEQDALYGERKRVAELTFIGEQLIVLLEDKSSCDLRVVDIENDRVLSRHPLPPDFTLMDYSLCGQTLVGMKGDDVVIYRLSLKES
jgi:hypothetical protein